AWGVRAAGNQREVSAEVRERVTALVSDPSPDVRLQVVIAARKVQGIDPLPLLCETLEYAGDDKLIPAIVWQNLHPLLEEQSERLVALASEGAWAKGDLAAQIMPRVVERMLGRTTVDVGPVATLLKTLMGEQGNVAAAGRCLAMLAAKSQTHEIEGERLAQLRGALEPLMQTLLSGPRANPVYREAALLAATWNLHPGPDIVRELYASAEEPDEYRVQAVAALVAAGDEQLLPIVSKVLSAREQHSLELRRRTLDALGRYDDPRVAAAVLTAYPKCEAELKPPAIELLTGRPAWSKALLAAIGAKRLPADALNVNQVRKLLASKDAELVRQVRA
ncbi:MAG: PVC-type heme-binding CxxCH protein, partial [Candidatus Saccharimonadales bacterium]